ncbi:uncharacterized protein LAESUDRAFT_611966, partial [Laetiporus sulphureus 93-53]
GESPLASESNVKPLPPYLRWLGLWLDRTLSFEHHIRVMAARAQSRVIALHQLANTQRGISVAQARLLYLSTVLPVLTFG